jgi:ubiquinone/menaquinone biosynthesis C-methylase UbiE
MPSVDENRASWDSEYAWERRGDEWSVAWGSADAQWLGSVWPRVQEFLPSPTVLEIAPGFGRWTERLGGLCARLYGVDLSEKCVRTCRHRFAHHPHMTFHVNDGTSLEAIPDASIDFVFSFDSLVHVEEEVIAKYLEEIAKKLTPNGVGFLHHSNLAEYARYFRAIGHIPGGLRRRLTQLRLLDRPHWRAST